LKRLIALAISAAIIYLSSVSAFAFDAEQSKLKADELAGYGLLAGTGDGYALDESVTRAQAVAMVLRFIGADAEAPQGQATAFSDISQSHWARSYIEEAVQRGIAKGVSVTEFAPERIVSSREFAAFMLRALGFSAGPDGDWFAEAVECGLLTESMVREFELTSRFFSRADMVEICYQALSAKTAGGDIVKEHLMRIGKIKGAASPPTFSSKLQEAMPKDVNYMISPFSLKMALAIAANGSDGTTRKEILDAVGISDLDKFNADSKKFIESINRVSDVQYNVANSIWHNSDYFNDPELGFSERYKKIVSEYYGGVADEITDSDGAEKINSWISAQTKEKITQVIDSQAVKESLSFLVNTIYFKGDWSYPFLAERTREATFTDRAGGKKTTLFMNQTRLYQYYENNDFQMISMPYKDGRTSMHIILPKPGKTAAISDAENSLKSMTLKNVSVSVPKFKTEIQHNNLAQVMKGLGVSAAFDPDKADFRNMYSKSPEKDPYIGAILQKTFIEVDEKGTEAAAATVIGMMTSSYAAEIIEFNCDRPFLYLIKNDAADDVLFMGEYAFVQ
jgi:serpin B